MRGMIVENNDAFIHFASSKQLQTCGSNMRQRLENSSDTFSGHSHCILDAVLSRICGGPGVDGVGLITLDDAVVASCGNGGDDTFAITVSSKH